jgi:hypothetical protein
LKIVPDVLENQALAETNELTRWLNDHCGGTTISDDQITRSRIVRHALTE